MQDAYDRLIASKVEAETRTKFWFSFARLMIGALLAVLGYIGISIATTGEELLLPGLSIILSLAVLGGPIRRNSTWYRIFNYLSYHRKSWTNAGTVTRANQIYDDVKAFEGTTPELSRLKRRVKIVFLLRMLGLVGILMIIFGYQWMEQRAAQAAHFERYGTHNAVHVTVHLDGSETVVIDPNWSQGTVRTTYEQPPRVAAPEPDPA